MEKPRVNPFLSKEVSCPVCGVVSPQRRLKAHLYIEQEREVDLHPTLVRRAAAGLPDLQPGLYFNWHCPACGFTAGHDRYQKPWDGLGLTQDRYQAALKEAAAPGSAGALVIRILGQGIGAEAERDHLTAARLGLLGVFWLEAVPEVATRDSSELGRAALRLAWIYREIAGDESLAARFSTPLKGILGHLAQAWPQAPLDESAALARSAQAYGQALEKSSQIASERAAVQIMLLVARIHLQRGENDAAQQSWSAALTRVRRYELRLRDLEARRDQILNSRRREGGGRMRGRNEKEKQVLAELDQRLVEMDATARNLKGRLGEVKDLLFDAKSEADIPAEAREAMDAMASSGEVVLDIGPRKRKKKFLGLF